MAERFKFGKLRPIGARRVAVGVGKTLQLSKDNYGQSVYRTPQWRELSKTLRDQADGCEQCYKDTKNLVVDHIVELRDGGEAFDVSNLRVVCYSCHTAKTNRAKSQRLDRDLARRS